jgi:hypothetical protein
VWLRVDDELRPEAWSDGSADAGPLPVVGQAMPPVPSSDVSVPVVHQGELLGAISIRMPKDEPLRLAGQQRPDHAPLRRPWPHPGVPVPGRTPGPVRGRRR